MSTGRRKATLEYLKLEEGKPFYGRFVRRTVRQLTDRLNGTGELKDTTQLIFEKMEAGEDGVPRVIHVDSKPVLCGVWEDAGLRGAMGDALVEPGDVIEIHKLGKTRTDRGTEVNQYDVYQHDALRAPAAQARHSVEAPEARA